MRALFVAAGPVHWASARLRMFWPADHLDADVITFDDLPGVKLEYFEQYAVVVFQKHGNPGLQAALQAAGKIVLYDACDPMWWFSPDATRDVTNKAHGITVSTQALADDWKEFSSLPVYVVRDGLKLEHYYQQREHEDTAPVRFIWYGVAANRVALAGAWANLSRLAANGHQIELTVFDNRPDVNLGLGKDLPVYYSPWTLEMENTILAADDIALLPPYPGPWGRVKSGNKMYTAWACGLPVTDADDYPVLLDLVMSKEERQGQSEIGLQVVRKTATAAHSAQDWREVFSEYV